MAIVLIDKDERFWKKVQGAEFCLRRVPQDLIQRWRQECTSRGRLDDARLGKMVIEYAVTDWRNGVFNPDGTPAKFSAELLMKLPGGVIEELTDVLLTNTDGGLDPTAISDSGSEQ